MRGLVKRRWIIVAGFVAVLGCVVFWCSRQRITLLNTSAKVQQIADKVPSSSPSRTNRLVLLNVLDFGYSRYVRGEAEELSYDGFFARKGVLSRGDAHDNRPLIINARIRAAVNLEQSSSALNAGPHPLLIDSFPWTYTARGASLFPGLNSTYSWLHHSFEITGIANDGTVTIVASGKRVLLKAGGKVKIERAMGLWRSTAIIRHRGIFDKGKIAKSKWLVVERD